MSPTILIISDDIIFIQLFTSYIEKERVDISIIKCENYQHIDEINDLSAIRLVFIDGNISTLSSIEVTRYMRINKKIIAPIWFFAEIITESYIYKVKEMGATQIIYKPFDPYEIFKEFNVIFERITI
jgi:DNA-binding response OmpR family regulator